MPSGVGVHEQAEIVVLAQPLLDLDARGLGDLALRRPIVGIAAVLAALIRRLALRKHRPVESRQSFHPIPIRSKSAKETVSVTSRLGFGYFTSTARFVWL